MDSQNQSEPATNSTAIDAKPEVLISSNHPPKKRMTLVIGCIVILLVGVGATGLFFMSQKKPAQLTEKQQVTVAKQPLTLTIDSPTENTVVENSQVMVKGKTLPNATVAFFTENADNSVESDADGNFSGTIELENGINTLTVTAYNDDGDEKTVVMDLAYDAGGAK